MKKPVTAKFQDWDCEVLRTKYADGRTALVLVNAEDRDLIATVSVNLRGEPLGANQVFVKDWSENEGMLEAMQAAGILKPTGQFAQSGFVSAPKCDIIHPDLMMTLEKILGQKTAAGALQTEKSHGIER